MNTDSSTPSVPTSPVFGFDRYIVRYGSIFLLIVGTFGNVLSFIIFTHGALRKSSTFRYLALLSLMDLLVLYSGLLDLFFTIEYAGAFSVRSLNQVTCRLHTFVTYWSQHSSSWILSFISVDRAVATNCIQFARKFCTPRSAEYIVAAILIVIALLNCHELVYLRLQDVDQVEIKVSTDEYTTISPLRTSLFTESSFISEDNQINNKNKQRRNLESPYLVVSICDSPQWNFLCSREKRDLSLSSITDRFFYSPIVTSMPNATTNSFISDSSTISSTVPHCAAYKGSGYEFFWDHVWEWIDVCLYAFIPFTVMSIGTFFIVYRVYYQHRRVFRSHLSGQNHQSSSATPNKAKSLFYLLFTLNLLYFILVSPVVLVTTLSRDQDEEHAYPRFKAIIYLMQYCNHSLNFIFYGITSPPYRRTLWEWFEKIFPRLPQCCQRTIRRRSKTIQTGSSRLQTRIPQQVRTSATEDQRIPLTILNQIDTNNATDTKDGTTTLLSK